jgi:hypothetical protein
MRRPFDFFSRGRVRGTQDTTHRLSLKARGACCAASKNLTAMTALLKRVFAVSRTGYKLPAADVGPAGYCDPDPRTGCQAPAKPIYCHASCCGHADYPPSHCGSSQYRLRSSGRGYTTTVTRTTTTTVAGAFTSISAPCPDSRSCQRQGPCTIRDTPPGSRLRSQVASLQTMWIARPGRW